MMLMKLVNTRNIHKKILFKNAILNPLSEGMWFSIFQNYIKIF